MDEHCFHILQQDLAEHVGHPQVFWAGNTQHMVRQTSEAGDTEAAQLCPEFTVFTGGSDSFAFY